MLRDRLRQEKNAAAKGKHRSEFSPPVMRSPALEAAERHNRQQRQENQAAPRRQNLRIRETDFMRKIARLKFPKWNGGAAEIVANRVHSQRRQQLWIDTRVG